MKMKLLSPPVTPGASRVSFHESTSQSARHHYHDAAAQSPFCQDICSPCTPLERKSSFSFHEKDSTFSLPSCSGGDNKKKSADVKKKVKKIANKTEVKIVILQQNQEKCR